MVNTVFIETFTNELDYKNSVSLKLSLESYLTYCIFKFCSPDKVTLNFVNSATNPDKYELLLRLEEDISSIDSSEIPWQVSSCLYPVVLYEDTIITGLCAVARHISKYRSASPSPREHEEGLLGFRKGCLQAPNEVSIWTKFCEKDLIKTIKGLSEKETLNEIPINLVRFENHLSKPVRVHNVYKLARELKTVNLNKSDNNIQTVLEKNESPSEKSRVPKTRKWKSNVKKELDINSSTKIEDLNIEHQFAEGPFLTLADLILLPLYHIIMQSIGSSVFELHLPLTYKWSTNLANLPELECLKNILNGVQVKNLSIGDIIIPKTDNVSLYKCDPKRHNPKKRLFTKEDDIEHALSVLIDGMELSLTDNSFASEIDWNTIPDGANPTAGHLPDERMARKSQQLENLALAVLSLVKEGDLIVDFCSGSGHLGILVAHLLPKCTVILLENKEQSLLRARKRVHEMNMKNVYFFQCNLDFFIGRFDIGIALHACGIASDLVLDKCLKANAKFVLCPCCYGSVQATDRLVYPRSDKFKDVTIDQYLCIGHAADQTHEEHPLTVRGAKCMAVIDSDRARLAEEYGYKVTLSRLKPLSCTPKNNLLIGVPA